MTAKPAPPEAVQVARFLLHRGKLASITESFDVPELLQGLGFETGVDLAAVTAASRAIEPLVGHPLPSRYVQAVAHTATKTS